MIIIGGCASTSPEQVGPGGSQTIPSLRAAFEHYVIQAGDALSVKVFGYPELTQNQLVRPDGKIIAKWVGEVQAVGLTPAELDAVLTEAYCEKIVRPELAVIMRSFGGLAVYVGGEVRRPGEIPLRGRLTPLQAIFSAGGDTEEAKLDSVILVRSYGEEPGEIMELDLTRSRESGTADIILQPCDILFVPETTIAKVDRFVNQYIYDIVPDLFRVRLQYSIDMRQKSTTELVQ